MGFDYNDPCISVGVFCVIWTCLRLSNYRKLTSNITYPMTIERTDSEVIIRLSPSLNVEELQQILHYLAYKEATAGSSATQEDVDALVADVKKDRWQRSQERYVK